MIASPNRPHFQVPGFESQIPGDIPFEELNPDRIAVIDTTKPLADQSSFKVSAEIEIGDKPFLILDFRDSPGAGAYIFPFDNNGPMLRNDVAFMVVDQDFSPTEMGIRSGEGYKAIRQGEPTTLGRSHYAERFDYSSKTSRDHAEILFDDAGNLTIKDLSSMNGTGVRAPSIKQVKPGRTRRTPHAFDRKRSGKNHDQARAAQQKAAQEIRDREDAEIRARQEEIRRAHAERLAALAIENERATQEWQAVVEKREEEISKLEAPIRTAFQRRDEHRRRVIQIPHELPIDDAAGMVRDILELRGAGKSDKQAFRILARDLHPDVHESADDRAQRELHFKFLGEVYDADNTKFKF